MRRASDGVNVNLFIGSTVTVENVNGTDVEMVQTTNYPWDGKVSITVNPQAHKKFSVRVRVPNRATSALYASTPEVNGLKSLTVNGSRVKPVIEKGYAVITRNWKPGDKVELELPMEVQRVRATDKIQFDRWQGRAPLRASHVQHREGRPGHCEAAEFLGTS